MNSGTSMSPPAGAMRRLRGRGAGSAARAAPPGRSPTLSTIDRCAALMSRSSRSALVRSEVDRSRRSLDSSVPCARTSPAALRASASVARASSWADVRIFAASSLAASRASATRRVRSSSASWRSRAASPVSRAASERASSMISAASCSTARMRLSEARPASAIRSVARASASARISSAARSAASTIRPTWAAGSMPRKGNRDVGGSSLPTPMAEHRYDPAEIEPRWQQVWADEHTWEVSNDADGRDRYYALVMLPYPSGEPHIGHLKVYSVGDAVAHFHRRSGRTVLNPMGYDAFGLPAENHAIKTGQHPRESTNASIAEFQRQFRRWGISVDWTREFGTHEPRYYRWTQWIFLQLFHAGLAYRKEAAVKWCPNDQTVLANEQVIDGRCERCGHEVEIRQLEQWFFRITDYADRLLDDLDTIDWPEHVKTMQRNWIGRSEGAEVVFRCEDLDIDYPVFTTRPDTLFGATFFVMAPEHPDIERLARGTGHEKEVRRYVNYALNESNEERGAADKEKTGVFLGRHVVNPVNGERLPMYVADYVLMEYGTGAIMAVPAHDERDYAFAKKFELPIRPVIQGPDGDEELPYTGDGVLVDSAPEFDGLHNREAMQRIVDWLDREGKGHRSVNYRLRDWLGSRQGYWGWPIPVGPCGGDGVVPVPERELPVRLPDIEDYAPRGRSPLATAEDWVNVKCPRCGGPARR